KSFSYVQLAHSLANELKKSSLSDKLKIVSVEICAGGVDIKEKEKIKIVGSIDKEDIDELKYMTNIFIDIFKEGLGVPKELAEIMVELFSEIRLASGYEVGCKFVPIEGSFNQAGNKKIIEHSKGKVMIINFWAMQFMSYCEKHLADLLTLSKELKQVNN